MEIYEANCAACHGSDGTGSISGIPDLTQVAGFKRGRDSDSELFRHIKHVKNGLKTPKSPLAMPAKGGNPNLTEQEIIEVLKYMREKFTNE
ncbi:c-type cytochrome [methane-oxidizing endosymbiont of Gigantopelta aegis]|uniref:c-type cytochrome n=1 Tax=methane-oxidizing endosymbiont of Gigantopelta aegis TaxID=2794938 RepID=UPI0018DCDEBE|nr:cytochrome c [methane-oxidizing endosymbiont of Gigantopelta aegis]